MWLCVRIGLGAPGLFSASLHKSASPKLDVYSYYSPQVKNCEINPAGPMFSLGIPIEQAKEGGELDLGDRR